MNINENRRNKRNNTRKISGYNYQITHISAANCSKVGNWVSNYAETQCFDFMLVTQVIKFAYSGISMETVETREKSSKL